MARARERGWGPSWWLQTGMLILLQQLGSASATKGGRSGRELLCVLMEHTFWQGEKNKNLPKVTGKDIHPLQGPKVLYFVVICGFILSLQTKALYASPHPFSLVLTLSLDQQSESAGKWEIYSENCHFPRLSTPPPHLHPPPKGLFSC